MTTQLMYSKSDNFEIMIGNETLDIIEELFESLLTRYQIDFETSGKGSDFVFNSIDGMYYKCHEIRPTHGGSYIDSLEWIKKRKATINKNSDDNCFEYAVTV